MEADEKTFFIKKRSVFEKVTGIAPITYWV
jgi:hypothetical protein